jgi:glycosyltransferase involved in cell wall biosynthesis
MLLFNIAHYLNGSLPSFLWLPIVPALFEVVCVHHGSTDRTHEVVARCQPSDSRIWLHRLDTNEGTHRVRIFAIRMARTPFLTFLEPGDRFVGNSLADTLDI